MVPYATVWFRMALYGSVWHCMVLHSTVWAPSGTVWAQQQALEPWIVTIAPLQGPKLQDNTARLLFPLHTVNA